METSAAFGLAMGVGRARFDGDVKYAIFAYTSISYLCNRQNS